MLRARVAFDTEVALTVSFAELGMVGLVVAGATDEGAVWVTARGWTSLDRD